METTRLNNAATTQPFAQVVDKVNEFMRVYGAVHRGAGPFASKTMDEYEHSVHCIKTFIETRVDQELLFTSNTTHAINLLSRLLDLSEKEVILTSGIEHTSNYLPWKFNSKAKLVLFKTNTDTSFDLNDLETKIEELKPTLVSITGAHNLTGYIPPLREIARKIHENGGKIFVDCAQLAPHRPLELSKNEIDYAAFSAHKIYAPFGVGVLVIAGESLEKPPAEPGGGTIDMLSENEIVWANGVRRHQSGTPNPCGVIALAESLKTIEKIGWSKVISREKSLTHSLVEGLMTIPKVRQYVRLEEYRDRTGAVAFNVNGLHHSLVSAILENEYGIETRSGTICNHRLVRKWMHVNEQEQRLIEEKIRQGNLLASYGIVRASIGEYNTSEDVEKLIEAIEKIVSTGPQKHYRPVPQEETFEAN